jgi:uncharacterized membrane protein
VATWLRSLGPARLLAGALPILLVVALTAAAVPQARQGMESIQAHREASHKSGFYPSDPIFPWFRDEMRSPAVVLAPDIESARIPAYSSEANVVSRRGGLVLRVLPELQKRVPGQIEVPQGSLDVREFFSGTTLQKGVEILRRNNVDYVMVAKDSQLTGSLERLAGFTPVETPSERYDLYAVDLRKVAWRPEPPMSSSEALSVEWPSLDVRPGRHRS